LDVEIQNNHTTLEKRDPEKAIFTVAKKERGSNHLLELLYLKGRESCWTKGVWEMKSPA